MNLPTVSIRPARRDELGSFPNSRQLVLLRAALGEDHRALEAWESWSKDMDLDALDAGSSRLLPLVQSNLRRFGVAYSRSDVLKGLLRRTWYAYQLQAHALRQLLAAFQAENVGAIVLKGMVVANRYYANPALRPMDDIDVRVRWDDFPMALRIAKNIGWRTFEEWNVGMSATRSTIELVKNGLMLDLHWHFIPYCWQADAPFAEDATPFQFGGVQTLALDDTDQLVHICVHGAFRSAVPRLRWIVDAVAILRHPDTRIDWSRLVRRATALRLILPLRHTLRYLFEQFAVPIPPDVLRALDTAATTRIERIEHSVFSGGDRRAALLPMSLFMYRRSCIDRGRAFRVGDYLGFVRDAYHLPSRWNVPLHFGRRAAQRLAGLRID